MVSKPSPNDDDDNSGNVVGIGEVDGPPNSAVNPIHFQTRRLVRQWDNGPLQKQNTRPD